MGSHRQCRIAEKREHRTVYNIHSFITHSRKLTEYFWYIIIPTLELEVSSFTCPMVGGEVSRTNASLEVDADTPALLAAVTVT